MRSIRVFILIFLVAGLTTAIFFFGFQNLDSVQVRFFHWALPERPLFIYLLLAAIAGMLVSTAIFGFEMIRLRARARRESKSRLQLQKEVDSLRNRPLFEPRSETELIVDDDEPAEQRETIS